jgi:transposase
MLWWGRTRPFQRLVTRSEGLLVCLRGLPATGVPRVVVLDDVGVHFNKAVKARRQELARRGALMDYLSAYSPEFNQIQPVFKQVRHHEIFRRSRNSKADLTASVESAVEPYRRNLGRKSREILRPAM